MSAAQITTEIVTENSTAAPQGDAQEYAAIVAYPPLPPLLDSRDGVSAVVLAAIDNLAGLVLEAEQTGSAHSAVENAVQTGEISEDELPALDDVWQEAMRKADEAAFALLDDVPPTAAADRGAMLLAFLRARAIFSTPAKHRRPWTALEAVDQIENTMPGSDKELGAALYFVLDCGTDQTDSAEWDAAVAAYEQLKSDRVAGAQRYAAWRTQLLADYPAHLLDDNLPQKVALRWWGPDDIANDVLVAESDRERLAAETAEWRAKADLAIDPEGHADADADQLYDQECDAEAAVLKIPAPNAAAMAYKMRIAAREEDDDKCGLDDLGYVSFLSTTWQGRNTIALFADALRLAGQDHPILHMGAFDPREWVSAFEDAGAFVAAGLRATMLIHPVWRSEEEEARAAALLAELAQTPWKYRAVALFAHARRQSGGDQVYTYTGERRPPPRVLPLMGEVDRISFYDSGDHAPGSLAEHAPTARVTRYSFPPVEPTEMDIVLAGAENQPRIKARAALTKAGRAMLKSVSNFNPAEVWLQFHQKPGQYIDPKWGLEFYDQKNMTQGPLSPRDAPDYQAWKALPAWQRRMVLNYAKVAPRRARLDRAVEGFPKLLAVSRNDRQLALTLTVRDLDLTDNERICLADRLGIEVAK